MRLDEFSYMGAETAGLTDAERTRFVCFGFDILSSEPSSAARVVTDHPMRRRLRFHPVLRGGSGEKSFNMGTNTFGRR